MVGEAEASLLKVLLKRRHMQGYRAFCKEYDKVAIELGDRELVGRYPSKAQFYRWISGELIGLPFSDHCRVLESMFPDWTVDQLFAPAVEVAGATSPSAPNRVVEASGHSSTLGPTNIHAVPQFADVTSIFASRAEFMHAISPSALLNGAKEICMVGLSLNMICQQYSDRRLISALVGGANIKCLFLDPDGMHIKGREHEESQPVGHLTTLTRLNIEALCRVRSKIPSGATGRLLIRTYDEPVRFNITIIDGHKCVAQPYLPDARGVESPTLVIEANEAASPGLFDTFNQVFLAMWDRAKEVG